jgi:hypothetical protein
MKTDHEFEELAVEWRRQVAARRLEVFGQYVPLPIQRMPTKPALVCDRPKED